MSEGATDRGAVDLLAQLCQRYEELRPAAHTAVMEAFNLCAEASSSEVRVDQVALDEAVAQLLTSAYEALGRLADESEVLRADVSFKTAQRLVADAASRL